MLIVYKLTTQDAPAIPTVIFPAKNVFGEAIKHAPSPARIGMISMLMKNAFLKDSNGTFEKQKVPYDVDVIVFAILSPFFFSRLFYSANGQSNSNFGMRRTTYFLKLLKQKIMLPVIQRMHSKRSGVVREIFDALALKPPSISVLKEPIPI